MTPPVDRRRFYLIGFALLMTFDTMAQVSFKFAALHALPLALTLEWLMRVFGQVWVYGAMLGYAGAFVTWMSLLEHAPIGPAFAASHLEIVSVLLLSGWLFGDHIGMAQAIGASLIVCGIVCLALGEARSSRINPASPA